MSDAIDRHGVSAWLYNLGYSKLADAVMDEKRFPPVQPEVIHCHDCFYGHGEVWLFANGNADFYGYCGKSGLRVLPYDFCSKGERREDGKD